ncbi:MAG: ArsR family transcriptional regulator [Nitrosopumilaceae archaeon]|nr:ArsR family transcriptional regulator [Nitrosopumilaceae archaeon]
MIDSNENDEEMNKIKIYSSDDETLKFFGNVLSNENSRKLLQMLFDQEMTSSEISSSSGMSLPLINHHLTTMLQAGIVTVSKTTMNTKNQPMKHYTAKSGIIILPKKTFNIEKKKKFLSVTLKTMLKFTSIMLAGVISFFTSNSIQQYNIPIDNRTSDLDSVVIDYSFSVIISLVIIGIGLSLQFWFNRKNNKKLTS